MKKILYIKADIKAANESKSIQVTDTLMQELHAKYPDGKIETLDLYKENIQFLQGQAIQTLFAPKDDASRNDPILKYAYQFVDADIVVVAVPMWNLGIPAILKAYIDLVSVVGITFKYTEQGAVGLLENKKAAIVLAAGGVYSHGPMKAYDYAQTYLRAIFSFFGIQEIHSVFVEGVDIQGNNVDAILSQAKTEAKQIGQSL